MNMKKKKKKLARWSKHTILNFKKLAKKTVDRQKLGLEFTFLLQNGYNDYKGSTLLRKVNLTMVHQA